MLIIPAIDLKDGRCVRLTEGKLGSERAYSDDPVDVAKRFAGDGAERLHVVDLDGAFDGRPKNAAVLEAIARAVAIPVQTGGGLRDAESVAAAFEAGAAYVILGTIAVKSTELFADLCRRHPGRIIAGIDARNGRVATEGWVHETGVTTLELARFTETLGAAAIIHTDIARDGTGQGVNSKASDELARSTRLPVIASGGVAGLEDIRSLLRTAVAGVVIGKALYEDRVDLAEAIALANSAGAW